MEIDGIVATKQVEDFSSSSSNSERQRMELLQHEQGRTDKFEFLCEPGIEQ